MCSDTLTLFPKSTDNTLAVNGTAFKISSNGTVTFISGQKFPGAGTITGVTTSSTSGLQGGGTTGTLNLSVKPAGVTNAMLQNSKITLNANTAGGLTTPGAMTLGSTFTIGLKPCSAKSGSAIQRHELELRSGRDRNTYRRDGGIGPERRRH